MMIVISSDHLTDAEREQESDVNFISGQMQNKTFSEKCLRCGALDLHHSGEKLGLESGEPLPFWVCRLSHSTGKDSFETEKGGRVSVLQTSCTTVDMC